MDSLVIVDCQYDFIEGTLACLHSREAVSCLIQFINTHDVKAFYTGDWHSPSNRSFQVNGGIWPVHCVAGEKGAAIDHNFSDKVIKKDNKPFEGNIFLKGKNDEIEEYSAFYGENEQGEVLKDVLSRHVYVGGIASEYCVKETVLDLLKAGHTVSLLEKGVGYVKREVHIKTLEELKKAGVKILKE